MREVVSCVRCYVVCERTNSRMPRIWGHPPEGKCPLCKIRKRGRGNEKY